MLRPIAGLAWGRGSRRPSLLLAGVLFTAACSDLGGPSGSRPVEMPVETTPAVAPAAPAQPPSRALVMLTDDEEDGTVVEVARALLARHAPTAGARADSIEPLLASRGFVAPLTPAELAGIATDERVTSAEPSRVVTIDHRPEWLAGRTPTLAAAAAPPWALDRVTQRALPLDGDATWDGTAAGVTIYVIDTGIRSTHLEYTGRVVAGPDFILGGASSGDCNGHGTRVASDAAGTTVGIARGARIVAVRVLDCNGSGTSVSVVQGIDWVISQVRARPGPAVINLSLGVSGICVPVNDAAARATRAGITVVAAAGNSNANACGFSPASEPTVITVGATDITDNRASFSNWGSCVDLYAPGASVSGADRAGDAAYAPWSGTSAAAPFVAGIAALYLERFPTASPSQVAIALTTGATANVVKGTNVSPNRLAYLAPKQTSSSGGSGGSGSSGGTLAPPVARATIACVRRSCAYDGRASTSGAALTRWTWDFGDGASGSGATLARTYAGDGRYVVRLTVTDASGATASRVDTARIVDAPPTVSATATCSAWTCKFDARATDDGAVVTYAWEWGDATSTRGPSGTPTHAYKGPGTYTVTLTVTDDVGQTARTTVKATTTPRPPTPMAKVTCTGRSCIFDGSGSTDDIGIAAYTWDFLDGTLQQGIRVTKVYPTAGTKRFRLTVRNKSGLSTSTDASITLR